jgi:HK97 family phage prohead protease
MSDTNKIDGKIISFTLDKLESEQKSAHGQETTRTRKIRGFANKNIVDRGNQRIEPAAFADAMKGFMRNPVLLVNHDWSTPIGRIDDFAVTKDGLIIEATLGEGFTEVDRVWKMIEQDLIRSFSVGLRPFDIENEDDGSEVITKLELFEVSIVTIPMNAESTFEVTSKGEIKSILVKSEGNEPCTYKQHIAVTAISEDIPKDETPSQSESVVEKEEDSKAKYLQPELFFKDGSCAFCQVEGHVVHCATSVYGESFYSCLDCTSKAFGDEINKAEDEEKLKAEFDEALTVLSDKLESNDADLNLKDGKINILTNENGKLKSMIKQFISDSVKSAVNLIAKD